MDDLDPAKTCLNQPLFFVSVLAKKGVDYVLLQYIPKGKVVI